MPKKRAKVAGRSPRSATASPDDVEEFLQTLAPSLATLARELRRVVLSASPAIRDGIKWNSVSFRTTEWFATFHVRAKRGIGVILHFGATSRPGLDRELRDDPIADPAGVLRWLAKDRALAAFDDTAQLASRRKAFVAVLRQWIGHL